MASATFAVNRKRAFLPSPTASFTQVWKTGRNRESLEPVVALTRYRREQIMNEAAMAKTATKDPVEENPKLDPNPPSNTQKDPDEWVSGGDPMTGAQASYLKTLSEQTHDAEAFAPDLTKAEASKRIDALKSKQN